MGSARRDELRWSEASFEACQNGRAGARAISFMTRCDRIIGAERLRGGHSAAPSFIAFTASAIVPYAVMRDDVDIEPASRDLAEQGHPVSARRAHR